MMGAKDRLKHGLLAVKIATTLGAAPSPLVKDMSPDLVKQQAKYSAQVRLPETRRDVERELRRATQRSGQPTSSLDKGSVKRLKKR